MKKIIYFALFVFVTSLAGCGFRTCPTYAKHDVEKVNSTEGSEANS